MSTVTLQPVDEDLLLRLLDVAVAEADPDEVMPPVPGPPGWTDERRAAFRDYLRSADDTTFAVIIDGEVVGAARIAPAEAPGAVETGIWLRRSARGKGHGTEALHLLVAEARARGTTAMIAETTASNVPAVGALRTLGAKLWEDPETGAVHATLRVGDSVGHGGGG
ncbi:MAG: family N-acetyltransferase [Actinoallomurus sp.]|nr:family N-acetyltransferase [Actinoallomurus sp.]